MQDEPRDAAGRHPSIHALFEEQARRTPDAPALVQGSLRLSYAQLDEGAARIAAHLQSMELRAQEPVGLFAGRSAQMVCAALGILRAGGCYVPIDPLLPEQRRRLIAADCGLRFVLADAPAEEAGAFAPAALSLIGDLLQAAAPPQALLQVRQVVQVQSDHLAYVMYTSGSTGRPKGVMVTHGNVANLARGNGYVPLEAGDRILMAGAVGFDAATFEVWGALLNGLSLHLADSATLLDAAALRTALRDGGITTLFLATALCSCVFQCKSTRDSDPKAPAIPIQTRQPFQFKPATDSDSAPPPLDGVADAPGTGHACVVLTNGDTGAPLAWIGGDQQPSDQR